MPRLRRRAIAGRTSFSDDHAIMLVSGTNDFSAAGWLDIIDLPPGERDNWPGAQQLAEMAECWAQHGGVLVERFADHRPLWGELVFEHDMDPQAALAACGRTRGERGTTTNPAEST